jgi:hypothetical protein
VEAKALGAAIVVNATARANTELFAMFANFMTSPFSFPNHVRKRLRRRGSRVYEEKLQPMAARSGSLCTGSSRLGRQTESGKILKAPQEIVLPGRPARNPIPHPPFSSLHYAVAMEKVPICLLRFAFVWTRGTRVG